MCSASQSQSRGHTGLCPPITLPPNPDSLPSFIIHPRAELHTFLLSPHTKDSFLSLVSHHSHPWNDTGIHREKNLTSVTTNIAECQGNKRAGPAPGLAPPGSQLDLPSLLPVLVWPCHCTSHCTGAPPTANVWHSASLPSPSVFPLSLDSHSCLIFNSSLFSDSFDSCLNMAMLQMACLLLECL